MSSYSPTAHRKGTDTLQWVHQGAVKVQHTAYEERPRKVGLFYLEKTRLRRGRYLAGVCRYLQQRLWRRWN